MVDTPSGAGARQLAIRVIGETGGRAAGRSFADALHPPRPTPRFSIERVPGQLTRRVLRRIDRVIVERAGGFLVARRRVDRAEAVRQVHRLDHRCADLERQVAELERRNTGPEQRDTGPRAGD